MRVKMKVKERINTWIEDYEDTSLLEESIGTKNVKNYLLDEAKQIFDKIENCLPFIITTEEE